MTTERAAAYRALVEQTLFDGDFYQVRGKAGDKAIANRFYNLIPLIADLKKADRAEENDMTSIDCGGCAPPVQVATPNDAARPVARFHLFTGERTSDERCGCRHGFVEESPTGYYVLAADYDALRQEVEKLRLREAQLIAAGCRITERAEAAEAKVGRLSVLLASGTITDQYASRAMRVALNEGDGE